MDRQSSFDIVVVGAGMVGAAAAALLARAGFSVAVVESEEPRPFDASQPVGLRVSAFSPGSADVLREAGAWRQVERQRHCAYRRMIVEDRDETSRLAFDAPEFGLERLGTIVENELVQWALWQSLLAAGGIELACPARVEGLERDGEDTRVQLTGGRALRCRLLAAADGADSALRKMLGIRQDYWEYGQMGVVGVVQTAPPNPGVAWQRFMDGGPLAFLPLQNGASSIVWTRPEAEAARLLELDDEAFLGDLQQAAAGGEGHWPDRLTGCGPRAAFPLTMRLAERYHARGAVLLGDAAHVVHPLAGQGVNLGLLDAAALAEVLLDARTRQEDIGAERTLVRYGRWRRSEAEIMARGIHGLRGLFTPPSLGLLRRFGLGLVGRSWTAREAFIRRATGRNRDAPALARGLPLTDLLQS
jgi:ubiquinone biosynthesis UbiH/UbiF/VisC/COQ6 family hydroxylase